MQCLQTRPSCKAAASACTRAQSAVVSVSRATSSVANTRSGPLSSAFAQKQSGSCLRRINNKQTVVCSAAVDEASSVRVNDDDVGVSQVAAAALQFAINFARVSETYEVHSWMIVLGLLKQEKSTAASVLKDLGLDDLYGAWHEVLWALNASDGLRKRAFIPDIKFSDRAFRIVRGSMNFAQWHGKDKVGSEDLLLALAAGEVLEGLFPDLPMKFEKVRKAIEKKTGRKYQLPNDPAEGDAEKSLDGETFL